MLQWRPGSPREVVWNDREDDRFVCCILDIESGRKRTVPYPVYSLSPDGRWAITADFRRLNDCRPGYGYAGIPDPHKEERIPEESGVWKVDLDTGQRHPVVSLAEAAKIPYPPGYSEGAKHWFNHLLISPDGSRFIFLHRWRGNREGRGFATRMFTCGADGKDLYVLDPRGRTSHFIWRDPVYVAAWAGHPSRGDRFYLFKDRTDQVEPLAPEVMTRNGHITYLPGRGNEWILNDTYPDRERRQEVYLYHVPTGTKRVLGRFHSPAAYRGEWRCDTHPRSSPDGTRVVIDSPHEGNGRQLYLIDISEIVRG
jgi:hypothetical protein